MGIRYFEDLRAWKSARVFKLAIYRLCEQPPLALDFKLRDQLRESAASAVSQIAEGFGRFYPDDNARFVAMAKASIIEAQNHLRDAVDRGHLAESARLEHDHLARAALREVVAWLEYLQSPQAALNAKRARAKRQVVKQSRKDQVDAEPGTPNQEPRTKNPN